jgi:hypothetical protein
VARTRLIKAWIIRRRLDSVVGSARQAIRPSGAPAASAAARITSAALAVQRAAFGWGEKMKPFLVFRHSKALKMAVEVGLATGMIPATMPKGAATS